MYNLRDEAQKRGVNIGWDPKTQNVNVGQHNLTPQQLTGMGGQNTQGSWQLPEQALNNLLGGSAQQPTTTPVQNNPLQYQPFQRQSFAAEKPDYDQYFGRALNEAMANREPLAQKAVGSVDENMAARGLYRSGVRESAATNAVAELEVALRNLAQQQAVQQYGMSLGQYNQDRQTHYANQDFDAQQHQFGQAWNRDNFLDERNFGYQQERDATGDQRWDQEFAFNKQTTEQKLANELRRIAIEGGRLGLEQQRFEQGSPDSEAARGIYQMVQEELSALPDGYNTQADARKGTEGAYNSVIRGIEHDVTMGIITPETGQKLKTVAGSMYEAYINSFRAQNLAAGAQPISGNPYIPDHMLID